MYKTIIFVDFENIQKIESNLINEKTKIIVMVGLTQEKKAFEYAKNIFNDISTIELIKVNGRGSNALDFFIAFYLGKYFGNIKEAEIIIISNDTGYDPLIKHLDGYGISIKRKNLDKSNTKQDKAEAKKEKQIKSKDRIENDDVKIIIEYLEKQTESQKNKRPKKITTLENDIYTHFSQKISMTKIKEAINLLKEKKKIIIENNKIIYKNI